MRSPNAVASAGTRAIAPPIGKIEDLAPLGELAVARAVDERVDRVVGEAGEVVAALPVAVAVRVDVVERGLERGVRHRPVQARDRRAERRERLEQRRAALEVGAERDERRAPACPSAPAGNGGAGGTCVSTSQSDTSSGASERRSRARCAARPRRRRARRRSARRGRAGRPSCSRYSNETTTPKLPEPPRRPQNRSGCSCADAVTSRPSAVTRSTESRLSIVRPYWRDSQPMPPPSVSPAMPVCEIWPPGTASPMRLRLAVDVAPERARLRPRRPSRSGSTQTPFMPREVEDDAAVARSSSRPRSARLRARRARFRSRGRSSTTATTSTAPSTRTIAAGLQSNMPFQIRRASS